jgi:hypothetical protein
MGVDRRGFLPTLSTGSARKGTATLREGIWERVTKRRGFGPLTKPLSSLSVFLRSDYNGNCESVAEMKDNSAWEMEVCSYCFERMHRTKIEEHKRLVHGKVMEAEEIVEGLAEHEKNGMLAICVWIGLETLIAVILYALDVMESLPWILITAGIFIGIGVIGVAVHFSTPERIREARKRAREVMLKRMVICSVCASMIPYEEYGGHIRRYHPKKMPYQWYRAALLVLLVLVGGGGYVALSLLSETQWLSDREGVLLVIGWIAGSCLILSWIIYEYHVGELKHIERMRRHWEEHRFDSTDSENE